MCSSSSHEEITSTSRCARATTAGVTNSSRGRLRAPSTLSVSHLSNHVPTCSSFSPSSPLPPRDLLFFFTRPCRPFPKGCATSPPRLRSSCKHTCNSRMLVRRSGIFFSQLPALSGIALPMKLPSSISRDASERSQCIFRCQRALGRTEC